MTRLATAEWWDHPVEAIALVAAAMLLSVIGLLLVRHIFKADWIRRHHEMASAFFHMIGTLYAVLIAFAIFVVWNASKDAGTNLEHEATEVADLSRLSTALPDSARRQIIPALMEYLNAVAQDEFQAMQEGRDSQRTWDAVQTLWDTYKANKSQSAEVQPYFTESLKHLTQLSDYRRTRLFASHGAVPKLLWCLLLCGAVLLVAFTYCVGHESIWSQAFMTAALAGVLTFSLFLIFSLDHPYSGLSRVTPQPFRLELQHVASRMPK